MTDAFKIYAHTAEQAEKYSFREADLIEGAYGVKRKHVGTLYTPGNHNDKFTLAPHTDEEATNDIENPVLQLADFRHAPGKARSWTADEAVAKAQEPEQTEHPIFTFEPVKP
ncbi:hypothetical protein [Burkholderia gladioli]|uniref:hypothetical protein n=1 Tax=Burkholderia gladioli TaxID=28095 RepID=UPI00163E1628|nr:hypothetical protein [Burkholderia gladioli]